MGAGWGGLLHANLMLPRENNTAITTNNLGSVPHLAGDAKVETPCRAIRLAIINKDNSSLLALAAKFDYLPQPEYLMARTANWGENLRRKHTQVH